MVRCLQNIFLIYLLKKVKLSTTIRDKKNWSIILLSLTLRNEIRDEFHFFPERSLSFSLASYCLGTLLLLQEKDVKIFILKKKKMTLLLFLRMIVMNK